MGDTEATLHPIRTVLSLVCHQSPDVHPNCRARVVRSAEWVYRATQKCTVWGSLSTAHIQSDREFQYWYTGIVRIYGVYHVLLVLNSNTAMH